MNCSLSANCLLQAWENTERIILSLIYAYTKKKKTINHWCIIHRLVIQSTIWGVDVRQTKRQCSCSRTQESVVFCNRFNSWYNCLLNHKIMLIYKSLKNIYYLFPSHILYFSFNSIEWHFFNFFLSISFHAKSQTFISPFLFSPPFPFFYFSIYIYKKNLTSSTACIVINIFTLFFYFYFQSFYLQCIYATNFQRFVHLVAIY